ncbi:MAG: DUF4139 domain-containing protein [Paracoccaceae bacterium]|nr:DUF4139 domain-containing protein [Paracoccaceae bacterium]
MRLLPLLALAALPLHAETIEAPSRVTAVTLYPWGASVTRQVQFEAPAGTHELLVPDLPRGVPAESLRVAADAGLRIGAVTLATGRLPAPEAEPPAEISAAEAEVERLESVLRGRDEAIAAIRLQIDAANEQWNFLRGLGQSEGLAALGADDLRALARLIGEETLAARQAAQAAEIEAGAAERAKKDDLEALEEARRVLEALRAESLGRAVLTLAVETAADGTQSLEVTTFTDAAGWRPVYDLRLSRGTVPALEIERSVFVSQASGEDWRGVELTLSTARPAERSEPSQVLPWLRRILREEELERDEARSFGGSVAETFALEAPGAEPAPAPLAETATLDYQGATVVYGYGNAVDIRDGVEDLRLRLDTLTLAPEIEAVAVPNRDDTAFLVAELTNATGEVLLPGSAMLYLNGAMVGASYLPLIAAGADERIGFGAIDGLRLNRTVPARTEGERGVLSTRNQLDEVAILKIENLTGEAWRLRVIDRVPRSEQDDLEIAYTATPPATEEDIEGARGVLAWEFELAPGETREIRLEHSLKWPEGYFLE